MTRLRPDVRKLVEAAVRPPWLDPFDPVLARQLLRQSSAMADLPRPAGLRSVDTEFRGSDGHQVPVRIYHPASGPDDRGRVVLYFHGGGWIMGDLDTHDGLCGAICEQMGMTLVAVDYRLAPEHPFPAALDDCRDAIRWVSGSPEALGQAASGLILAGDSAGGNLAASCALHGAASLPVLALWTIYASFDMEAEGGSLDEFAEGHLLSAEMVSAFRQAYFADASHRRSPQASPLVAADLSHLPPSLIFANECDPLRDQSRDFAARLCRAGVPVRYREARGHVHGSLCRRAIAPSGNDDLRGCILDLRSLLDEAAAFENMMKKVEAKP